MGVISTMGITNKKKHGGDQIPTKKMETMCLNHFGVLLYINYPVNNIAHR